jgi:receptor protein-tyrosine kinase
LRDFLTHRTPLPGEVREAFRTLRANLAADGGLPRTILVTSSISGEGKTLACANLASAIAAVGERVLLIDGDFRKPMLATVFGVPTPGSGVIDVMLGKASRDGLVSPPGYAQLRLLPSNPRDADLIDLVEPLHAEQVLEQLKREADVIIIDSPPLTEFADALIWAGAADTILLAVRIGRSRRDKLDELLRTFGRRGVAPAGVVLTTRERPHNRRYYRSAPEFGKLQAVTPPVLADGSSESRAASGEIEPG